MTLNELQALIEVLRNNGVFEYDGGPNGVKLKIDPHFNVVEESVREDEADYDLSNPRDIETLLGAKRQTPEEDFFE